jgi:hypothetical protein
MDTGADQTALARWVAEYLGVDVSSLPKDVAKGAGIDIPTRICDFIEIAFLDGPNEYWPNKQSPVPLSIIDAPRSLLGRELFLDRCVLTFDGPNQVAFVEF